MIFSHYKLLVLKDFGGLEDLVFVLANISMDLRLVSLLISINNSWILFQMHLIADISVIILKQYTSRK